MTTNIDRLVKASLVGTLALLVVGCGGAGTTDTSTIGAKALSATQEPNGSKSSQTSDASAQPDAQLTAKELALAESDSQKADVSQPLESLPPGTIANKEAYVSGAIVRKAAAVAIPAYRFYNASTGAHFYTISTSERDKLVADPASPFKLEGQAFSVASVSSPGLSPVYRFFNSKTGVHFYTISEAERAKTVASMPQFTYEGVAYYASMVAGSGLTPFYRFFVTSKGFHFYTASTGEKTSIQADQNSSYSYEGIGYYVFANASDTPVTTPVTTSLMPMINKALIPTGAAGSPVDRINATSERPVSSDGTGAFRTVCDFSHMAFDDPIVYPGQSGRSHLHTFFGNTASNANSTATSIASTGNSTCRGGTANRSSYWVPSMIDTRDGRPIKPSGALFYYKTGYGGVAPNTVQSFPLGLRMIAGDLNNATPTGQFLYSCNGEGAKTPSIPNCAVGSLVTQQIFFPQCWDGVNLDSPDHKSHMAYPTGKGCPASHPKPVPEITFNIEYLVSEANSPLRWRLSSDNYSTSLPGGYSAHGDWFNGWRPEIMDAFVKNCDRPALDCHAHLLGDGREIY